MDAQFELDLARARSRSRIREPDDGVALGLLDINSVAERLGVTPRFVRRLIAERRIPYIKVGRYVRVEPSELEAWILDHRVEPVADQAVALSTKRARSDRSIS